MKGEARDTKLYMGIAFFVIIVIFFGIIFSGGEFTQAYVDDDVIINGWVENPDKREHGDQMLGLEKWGSFTYEENGIYPAYLTVTTIKTLVMMNEKGLQEQTQVSIEAAEENGIIIDVDSMVIGERVLKNEHKTTYIIYNGTKNSTDLLEKIRIIGEVWNCGSSGTSVICIGVAQITNYADGNTKINTSIWEKIVSDKEGTFGIEGFQGTDGLIYNVICH